MGSDAFDIPGLIQDLRASNEFDRVPTYSEVWRAVAEARFPATRVGRVWRIARQDRDRAAAALGLKRGRQPTAA